MEIKRHIFLMYCGLSPDGKEYRKWTAQEVEPVLCYREGNRIDPFFPAVLLLAVKSGNGGALIPGFGASGNKDDWLAWLDDIFLPGHNLEAIADAVKKLTLPPVDIWVALPYPDPAARHFGYIGGRRLYFSRNSDRKTALKWWINRLLARWHGKIKAQGLERYIALRGFYWARESMGLKDRLLLPGLISHIRSLGYMTLWIPYYAATPLLSITNPGFDITIIQPSYLQNHSLGWQRISAAAEKARRYRAGVEIEFDTSAIYQNSQGFKVAVDYLNRGLPGYDGYMTSADTPIAYYTGYKTIVHLYKNNSPLYTYLYRFVTGKLQKIEYPGVSY